MALAVNDARTASRRQGLAYWMRRALTEGANASRGFSPDAVHDLRVALRRCRSMADGLLGLDADPAWPAMKRAGRRLFRRLGDLRDTHVMIAWVQKLAPEGDLVGQRMLQLLMQREAGHKTKAEKALSRFDRAQWKVWAKHLAHRADRVPPNGSVFQHLALERWQEAYALHRRALRNRSRAAWHSLRIGIKRFRYVVENFLPERHAVWGKDLKQIQDLLGEVHDLDVLWEALSETGALFDESEHTRWRALIDAERNPRLAGYREKMVGKSTLWHFWRAGLPEGAALRNAVFARLSSWAGFRDPDHAHARYIAHLTLNLYDGLKAARLPGPYANLRSRDWLYAAALLHNVSRASGRKGHHKAAYRQIRDLTPPLGWSSEEMEIIAQIARYHRGAEPSPRHAPFASLPADQREAVMHLGGLLRLAAALDATHNGSVQALRVESQPDILTVWAKGYMEDEEHARMLAAERHLLERALKKPVLIRPYPSGPGRVVSTSHRVVEVAD